MLFVYSSYNTLFFKYVVYMQDFSFEYFFFMFFQLNVHIIDCVIYIVFYSIILLKKMTILISLSMPGFVLCQT